MVEIGIARKAEKWRWRRLVFGMRLTKNYWLAWLDQHSGKEEAGLQVGQRLFHEIKFAHGNAAGKQQQISRKTFFDGRPEGRLIVRGNRQPPRLSACQQLPGPPVNSCCCCESAAVRAYAGFHQLVTG